MIEIDGRIVSTDILTEMFACDIAACKGICCVEGNAGAPLEEDEPEILEREYHAYSAFMTRRGREAVARQGFAVVDTDGDLTTPLVDDAECAFACSEGGVTLCAIEKACRAGLTGFSKPVSCHLYPIRITRFSDGSEGLNYHRWDICRSACSNGRKAGIKVYESLRDPIVRRFGSEFYEALEEADRYISSQQE